MTRAQLTGSPVSLSGIARERVVPRTEANFNRGHKGDALDRDNYRVYLAWVNKHGDPGVSIDDSQSNFVPGRGLQIRCGFFLK